MIISEMCKATRTKAVVEPVEGGALNLYDGKIVGKFVSLVSLLGIKQKNSSRMEDERMEAFQ